MLHPYIWHSCCGLKIKTAESFLHLCVRLHKAPKLEWAIPCHKNLHAEILKHVNNTQDFCLQEWQYDQNSTISTKERWNTTVTRDQKHLQRLRGSLVSTSWILSISKMRWIYIFACLNDGRNTICRNLQSADPLFLLCTPRAKECSVPHRKSVSALNQLCPVRKALCTWMNTLCF